MQPDIVVDDIQLTPAGVLEPLVDYCLYRSHDRSLAWMAKRKTAKWVKAGLQARVRHLRGGDKLLRHATLQGLDLRDS